MSWRLTDQAVLQIHEALLTQVRQRPGPFVCQRLVQRGEHRARCWEGSISERQLACGLVPCAPTEAPSQQMVASIVGPGLLVGTAAPACFCRQTGSRQGAVVERASSR